MKSSQSHNKLSSKSSSRKRIFVNISLLVSLYFISWFPQFVTQVLIHPGVAGVVGVKVDIYVRYFTFVMFYLNLVFDPLVYTLHHNAKLLCCGIQLCKEKSNSETLVTYNRRRSNSKSGVIENISISNVLS